jgi:glycosyltransferase involved in cell wall biosynthesis
MLKEHFPEKTNFVPHTLPQDIFFKMPREEAMQHRVRLIGEERKDHFVCIWVNRNARRKMPGNVMLAWKQFLDKLEETHGHRNATLLMHTAPGDPEGQNLPAIADQYDITQNVVYSAGRVSFDEMRILYNVSDFCINIACHEGFGLSTLEAMQCGLPIIALKTGGLTRQVVDHRDGTENGIALEPEVRDLVGGQTVPYIYEDHISTLTVADACFKMYEMGHDERVRLGQKGREYVLSEFNIDDMINSWDQTMSNIIDTWKTNKAQIYQPREVISL